MPKIRAPKLETATARLRLAVKKTPYSVQIAPGLHLCYFRNQGAGSFSRRVADGAGGSWMERIGIADDYERGDAKHIFSFWQAADEARKRTRREPGDPADDDSRPVNVKEALDRYEIDLRQNGGDPYNARRARLHLTPTLASRPVATLSRRELLRWRDGLLSKGLAALTVNRTRTALRAALELAAAQDSRIRNTLEFKMGLPGLTGLPESDNVVLDDETVRHLVAACYARDRKLGVLADTMSVTGCRPGQLPRLLVGDLVDDAVAPKLRMPKSGKGGARDRAKRKSERYSVPITPALAAVLREEAAGRLPADVLLSQANGKPWGKNPSARYRDDMIEVVTSIGLDPAAVTLYCLRHSMIVRGLKAGVPIRVIAAAVDSSVQQIERVYSRHITQHSDEVLRQGLLHPEPRRGDNIVPLVKP